MGILWRAACGAIITALILSFLAWSVAPAGAWDRGQVETFAVLPAGATGLEGIAVGNNGKVYVATFGFTASGPVAGSGKI